MDLLARSPPVAEGMVEHSADAAASAPTDGAVALEAHRARRDMDLIARVLEDAAADDDPGAGLDRLLTHTAAHFGAEMAALVADRAGSVDGVVSVFRPSRR